MKWASHRVRHDRLTGEIIAIFGSFVVIDVLVAVFVFQFSLLNDLRNEAGTSPQIEKSAARRLAELVASNRRHKALIRTQKTLYQVGEAMKNLETIGLRFGHGRPVENGVRLKPRSHLSRLNDPADPASTVCSVSISNNIVFKWNEWMKSQVLTRKQLGRIQSSPYSEHPRDDPSPNLSVEGLN